MKVLYLVRHAKSSWKDTTLPDHKRPLLEKGKKRTKKVIDFLWQKKVSVNYMISSPAVRAYETSMHLAKALNYPVEKIQLSPHAYYGDAQKLFNLICAVSNDYNKLMLIGHNPALTNLINDFIETKIDYLPTSGIVALKFQTDRWTKIGTAERVLDFVVYPKMIADSKSDYLFSTTFLYDKYRT